MSLLPPDLPSATSGHINAIAENRAKAGKEKEVRSMLSGLVGAIRQEDGCRQYHLLEARHTPGLFFTYEEWTSEDKLRKHLDGFRPKLEALLPMLETEPTVTVFNHLL